MVLIKKSDKVVTDIRTYAHNALAVRNAEEHFVYFLRLKGVKTRKEIEDALHDGYWCNADKTIEYFLIG